MLKSFLLSVIVLPGLVCSQAEKFQARTFQGKGGLTLPYRIFVPAGYKAGTPVPLVLALHGSGERGSNNTAQLTANRLATTWADDTVQSRFASIVVAPQCPSTDTWVDYYKPVNSVAIKPPLAKVVELLDSLAAEFSLDANRLYVVGLSMGGFASWDLLARHPGRFAAAVPICGAGDTTKASLMKTTPIWAFHGDLDNVVPVAGSRNMIAALKKVGTLPEPKYTEFKGVYHDSWVPAMKTPDLPTWLFAQKKSTTRIRIASRRTPRRMDGNAVLTVTLDGRLVITPAAKVAAYPVEVKLSGGK